MVLERLTVTQATQAWSMRLKSLETKATHVAPVHGQSKADRRKVSRFATEIAGGRQVYI